jgi:hypothetical protein
MPTEYTPTASWHDTITCVAAGDYMRPSGIVAGLEDLADNIAHTKQTTDKVLVQQAILTPYELSHVSGAVPGDIRLCSTAGSESSEGALMYRLAPGNRTCYGPWQMASYDSPGHWELIGAQTEDTYSGVVRFGPRLQSGDTTPIGRIPEQRLQGHVRHSAALFTTGSLAVPANNSGFMSGLSGHEFDYVQLGDVIEGNIGPISIYSGAAYGAPATVELRGTFDILGTPQTVTIFSLTCDTSSAGWHLSVPFRVGAPKVGKMGLVLWGISNVSNALQVSAIDATGRMGAWHVFRGTTL